MVKYVQKNRKSGFEEVRAAVLSDLCTLLGAGGGSSTRRECLNSLAGQAVSTLYCGRPESQLCCDPSSISSGEDLLAAGCLLANDDEMNGGTEYECTTVGVNNGLAVTVATDLTGNGPGMVTYCCPSGITTTYC